LVVSSGNFSARSKRICTPNLERVPVPVRSPRRTPVAITSRTRSRYWFSSCAGRAVPSAPGTEGRAAKEATGSVEVSSVNSYERVPSTLGGERLVSR
jgi:hypothetical protein